MIDYSVITDDLLVGTLICDKYDVEYLMRRGVTHIINSCAEKNYQCMMDHYPQVKYLHCPELDDGFFPKPTAWFKSAIEFSKGADKLYVHCVAGLNRSTSLAFAILRSRGMGFYEARDLIREKRPIVVSDFGLCYVEDAELALLELGYHE